MVVDHLKIISKAKNVLPFEIITSHEISEDIRLKYRYLDMRNKKVHDTIVLRSKVLKFIRNKMDELGFTEVQTPIITASSPEGARDFIIPSRKHHGKFYAHRTHLSSNHIKGGINYDPGRNHQTVQQRGPDL